MLSQQCQTQTVWWHVPAQNSWRTADSSLTPGCHGSGTRRCHELAAHIWRCRLHGINAVVTWRSDTVESEHSCHLSLMTRMSRCSSVMMRHLVAYWPSIHAAECYTVVVCCLSLPRGRVLHTLWHWWWGCLSRCSSVMLWHSIAALLPNGQAFTQPSITQLLSAACRCPGAECCTHCE